MKILALMNSINPPQDTIDSVRNQTVKVDKFIIMTEKLDDKLPIGVRQGILINKALKWINLQDYDWILKIDDDVFLPRNFIEENLKQGGDIIGTGGHALLIKVKSFLSVFDKYPEVISDDTYLGLKFVCFGYKRSSWKVRAIWLRFKNRPIWLRLKKDDWLYHFYRGTCLYRLGYEPIHLFYDSVNPRINPWIISGYFYSFFSRIKRFSFADKVTNRQIRRLVRCVAR